MPLFKNKNTFTKGFTLVEIIVVITILGIISTFSFRTYKELRLRYDFENSLLQVLELMKVARNYAITSRTVQIKQDDNSYISVVPKHGYGVYLDLDPGDREYTDVILFANTYTEIPPLNDSDPPNLDPIRQYNEGEDIIIEKITLPTRLIFFEKMTDFPSYDYENAGLQDQIGDDIGRIAVIIFSPPLAEAFISNNGDPDIQDNLIDTISIQMYQGSHEEKIRIITIDKVGGFTSLHL